MSRSRVTLAMIEAAAAAGAGGWARAGVNEETQAVAAFAAGRMTPPGLSVVKIEAAETQVVAGLNYRLTLKLSDGSRHQVTSSPRHSAASRSVASRQRRSPAAINSLREILTASLKDVVRSDRSAEMPSPVAGNRRSKNPKSSFRA